MFTTTHPYHLTEFKLCRIRDPSTDTVIIIGPVLPRMRSRPLLAI